MLGVVVLLVASRLAFAAPRGLELVWSAPEGCPGEADVLAAVEQLAGGPDAALERPLRAEARVERTDGGFRLALAWKTATASAVRTVEGATCAEIAQAAAVIVALAADPATNLEEQAEAKTDEVLAPPPLAPPPPKAQPEPPAPRSKPEPPQRDDTREQRARAGVRFGTALDFGSLPRAAPGVFVGGALPVVPLNIVVDALTFVPMDEVVPEGAGSFWLSALSLRPCVPLPVSKFVLAPCATGELHLMFGEGDRDRVDIPDERWAAYVRLGGGLEASYRVSAQLELILGGVVLAAWSRPTFVVGGTPVHRPGTVAGRLNLGLVFGP